MPITYACPYYSTLVRFRKTLLNIALIKSVHTHTHTKLRYVSKCFSIKIQNNRSKKLCTIKMFWTKETADLLQELVVFLSDQNEPIQNSQMCVTCNTHRRDEAPVSNIRRKSQTAENTLKQKVPV
jgi:hypothetical protein